VWLRLSRFAGVSDPGRDTALLIPRGNRSFLSGSHAAAPLPFVPRRFAVV